MARVIIIGAGVVGSVAAKLATEAGHEVSVYDDRRPLAGSVASAGVMHPGWAPVTPERRLEALRILDRLYGVQTASFFDPRTGKSLDVEYLSPKQYLWRKPLKETIRQAGKGWAIAADGSTKVGHVLVATGAWAPELVYGARVEATMGTGFWWKDACVERNVLTAWAPYKQVMVFNRDGGVWGGDGSAILAKNYSGAREAQSLGRVVSVQLPYPLRAAGIPAKLRGLRPVIKGNKQGFCGEVMRQCWMATGGSKSSTLLAALWAQEFVESLPGGG